MRVCVCVSAMGDPNPPAYDTLDDARIYCGYFYFVINVDDIGTSFSMDNFFLLFAFFSLGLLQAIQLPLPLLPGFGS